MTKSPTHEALVEMAGGLGSLSMMVLSGTEALRTDEGLGASPEKMARSFVRYQKLCLPLQGQGRR